MGRRRRQQKEGESSNTKAAVKKPGPKPADDPLLLQNVLLANKDQILRDGKIISKTDPTWEEIREKYSLNTKALGMYSFVTCNRGPTGGILYEMGVKERKEATISALTDEEDIDRPDTSSISSLESVDSAPDLMRRTIFFPKEKWLVMKPKEVKYKRGDPTRKGQERLYLVLEQDVWTTILNAAIHKETKLPCSWNFKSHHVAVSDEAEFFLKLKGSCQCGGQVRATCPNPLPTDPLREGLYLDVEILNARKGPHPDVTKRPITGKERRDLGTQMVEKNTSASLLRKQMAGETMDLFDVEPGILPKLATLRKIKSDALSKQKLVPSPIDAIAVLKYASTFVNSIFDIGHNPFFVHYYLPDQLRVYNAYVQKVYSRIIVDASGKVVRKLETPGGLSGHIFLYSIVVSVPGEHEGQIPVGQMLSERHHVPAITFWFKRWLHLGAKVPQEIVIDFSLAFLAALCDVFGHVRSTNEYIDMCFLYIRKPMEYKRPPVLIRIDIAHLVKMLSQWQSLKSMRKRSKEFYMRSIYLIILAQTFEEAEAIIRSILIVASNETEGVSTSTGEVTPCEVHKQSLLDLIGQQRASMEYFDDTSSAENVEEEDDPNDSCNEPETQPGQLRSWLQKLYADCIDPVNVTEDGDRDNLMYSTKFREAFFDLCLKLPLWSNILARKMQSPYENAVGAHVESYFNDLKTRLIKDMLPADLFLQRHLELLKSTMVLASSLTFFHQDRTCILCLLGFSPTEPASKCCRCNHKIHEHNSCSILRTDMTRICVPCSLNKGDEGPIYEDGDISCPDDDLLSVPSIPSPVSLAEVESDHGNSDLGRQINQRLSDLLSVKESEHINSSLSHAEETPRVRHSTKRGKENSNNINVEAEQSRQPVPELSCPACKSGNLPDANGSHKCSLCNKPCHALPGCSYPAPGSEEGFGQARICQQCQQCAPNPLEPERSSPVLGMRQPTARRRKPDRPNTVTVSDKEATLNLNEPEVSSPILNLNHRSGRRGKLLGPHSNEMANLEVILEQNEVEVSSPVFTSKQPSFRKGKLVRPNTEAVINVQETLQHNGEVSSPILNHGRPTRAKGKLVRRNTEVEANLEGPSDPNDTMELWHVENWRGLALPPKKRGQSYYAQPCPELQLSLQNDFKSKLKPLQNGGSVGLRPRKVGAASVSLSNTCGFDALVHLLATAYCDSQAFRQYAMTSASPLMKLAIHISTKGVQAAAYQLRAEMLMEHCQSDCIDLPFGVVSLNCARTPLYLASKLGVPPSLLDLTRCSSMVCPSPSKTSTITVLAASPDILQEAGLGSLDKAIMFNQISNVSPCLKPFTEDQLQCIDLVPENVTNYPIDCSFSKSVLCAGVVSHHPKPLSSLLVSVSGSQNACLTASNATYEEAYKCKLSDIPCTLNLFTETYTLRGAIAFIAPHVRPEMQIGQVGLGHYVTYSRRIGGKWEMFDDLKKKQEPVKSSTETYLDLLLYTVS